MQHIHHLRVRYSETDQMGTYYNSRALEWFECGRTEACRATGKPYTEWERDGIATPIIEAHVAYRGKAQYDDLLKITTDVSLVGRMRMRFDMVIDNADSGEPICRGYTIHAITNLDGRPTRPPGWIGELFRA